MNKLVLFISHTCFLTRVFSFLNNHKTNKKVWVCGLITCWERIPIYRAPRRPLIYMLSEKKGEEG